MEKFPSIVEQTLAEFVERSYKNDTERIKIAQNILKTNKTTYVAAYMLLDDCFANYICVNPYSGLNIYSNNDLPHSMVYTEKCKQQLHLTASHKGQWYIFLEILINSASSFSKINVDETKANKSKLSSEIRKAKRAAEKLAKALYEIDAIENKGGYRGGYRGAIKHDVLELIQDTAITMRKSKNAADADRAIKFEVTTKPEIERIHQWADSRRMPLVVNLIEQIALDANPKDILFSRDTHYMEANNQKFNICLDFFFDELKRQVKIGQLNPSTIDFEWKVWADIFFTVLGGEVLVRENFDKYLPITITT